MGPTSTATSAFEAPRAPVIGATANSVSAHRAGSFQTVLAAVAPNWNIDGGRMPQSAQEMFEAPSAGRGGKQRRLDALQRQDGEPDAAMENVGNAASGIQPTHPHESSALVVPGTASHAPSAPTPKAPSPTAAQTSDSLRTLQPPAQAVGRPKATVVESTHGDNAAPATVAPQAKPIAPGATGAGSPPAGAAPDARPAKLVATIMARSLQNQLAISRVGLPQVGGFVQGRNRTADSAPPKQPASDAPSHSAAQKLEEPAEFNKLLGTLRLRQTSKHSSARLDLDPPSLGRMQVDVRLEQQRVTIDVHAETAEARQLLADRAESLRVALEKHGIDVAQFRVMQMPQSARTQDLSTPRSPAGRQRRAQRSGQSQPQDLRFARSPKYNQGIDYLI